MLVKMSTKRELEVGILGVGTMGTGIAQVFALHGITARIYDTNYDQVLKVKEKIENSFDIMREAGIISGMQATGALNRVQEVKELKNAVAGVGLVLEAIPEIVDLKIKLFEQVDSLCDPRTILASNTSGLSITKLGKATKRPGRVIGMHWWNPPMIIPVIEIVRGEQTDEETVETVRDIVNKVGKVPVVVQKDIPGFLGNRLQYALMREAIALLNEGVASAEDIDTMVKAGIGFKFPVMGPLETIDLAGIDVYHRVSGYLNKSLDDSKETPAIVEEMVRNEELGLKKGKGFYDYTGVDVNELTSGRMKKLMVLLKDLGYVP